MENILKFDIIFKKKPAVYFSGELLSGTVHLSLKEGMIMDQATITISGSGKIEWGLISRYSKNNVTQSVENYIKHSIRFIKDSPDDDIYLDAGEYNFDFETKLPENLPSSFEHPIANIRYEVDALLIISRLGKFVRESRLLTVIRKNDLNTCLNLSEPFKLSETKKFGFFSCLSQPLYLEITLEKTGYVAGEEISFCLLINNKTDRKLKEISIHLTQHLKFNASSKKEKSNKTVVTQKYPIEFPAKHFEIWKSFLKLPPLAPSTNHSSANLVNIKYLIECSISDDNASNSNIFTLPIVIGSIPFYDENKFKHLKTIKFEQFVLDYDDPKKSSISYLPYYPIYSQ